MISTLRESLPYMKKWFKQLYPPISISITRQSNPILLGRWRLQHDNQTIYNRVDLANHDHCGTCQYHPLLNSRQNHQTSVTKKDNH